MKLTPAYLSSNFENVRELTSMKLDKREIAHIDDISFLVNLKRLDLSNNNLKSAESLSGLQYCKSLVWLNLSGNQLSDVHYLLGLPNLSVLNLSHNEIEMIPEGISKLENLQALIINDNQIKSLSNVSLPKTLNTLVLSKNQIEDAEDAFKHLEQLEKLSLSHNRLHQWPVVRKCWAMKELRLNGNKIFKLPVKIHDIPPNLQVLDLGHNSLKDESELSSVKQLRHLSSLTITGNPLWNDQLEEKIVASIPTLQILNSRRCRHDQKRKRGPRHFKSVRNGTD